MSCSISYCLCDTLMHLWNVHTYAYIYIYIYIYMCVCVCVCVLGWEELRKTTEHISQASQ